MTKQVATTASYPAEGTTPSASLVAESQRLSLDANEAIMEKRRFTRIRFNMAAELTVNNTAYTFSQVDNLSVGGCSLETGLEVEAGTACRFWLPLEATTALGVEAHGKVVRCDGKTLNIQFTRISPESLFHLHNIIRFNASDPDRIEDEISARPGLV